MCVTVADLLLFSKKRSIVNLQQCSLQQMTQVICSVIKFVKQLLLQLISKVLTIFENAYESVTSISSFKE